MNIDFQKPAKFTSVPMKPAPQTRTTGRLLHTLLALCAVALLPGCEGMALEAKNKRMIAAHNSGELNDSEFKKWQKTYAYLNDRYDLEMQLMFKPSDEVYRYWVATGRNTLATKHYIVQRNPSLAPLLFPPPPDLADSEPSGPQKPAEKHKPKGPPQRRAM